MLNKVYSYVVETYDYFDYEGRYTGRTTKKFLTLKSMWEEYKDEKTYNYGDSHRYVGEPFSFFHFTPDEQRPHVRSKYEWEEIQKNSKHTNFEFDEKEIEYLNSLFQDPPIFDTEDEGLNI